MPVDPASGADAGGEATDAASGESRGHSRDTIIDRSGPAGSFVVSCSKSALTLESFATIDIPCSVRSVDGYEGSVSVKCDYPPQDQHCFLPDRVFVPAGGTTAFTFRFENADNNADAWGFPLVLSARDWPLGSDFTIKVNVHRTRLDSCGSTSIGPGGVSCAIRWDPKHLTVASLDMVESSSDFTCTARGYSGGQSTEGSVAPQDDGTAQVDLSCTGARSPSAAVTLRVTVDGHTDSFYFSYS